MPSTLIADEFELLFTTRPHYGGRNWINIDCPACGDSRKRLGFARTPTGGFRCYCFNGGCTYNVRPTGWEPGHGLTGRVRDLFVHLGGWLSRIPLRDRVRQVRATREPDERPESDITTRFPPFDLDASHGLRNCGSLVQWADRNEAAHRVLVYLQNRGRFYPDVFVFAWSPEHPTWLIIPCYHYDSTVGYIARDIEWIRGGRTAKYIQHVPEHYLFNQHTIFDPHVYAFVVESPLDAIAIRGFSTTKNTISEHQVNLLNRCGRQPVCIPDHVRGESDPFLTTARQQGWGTSIPNWGGKHKDPGSAVEERGLLGTVQLIVHGITTNPIRARIEQNLRMKEKEIAPERRRHARKAELKKRRRTQHRHYPDKVD